MGAGEGLNGKVVRWVGRRRKRGVRKVWKREWERGVEEGRLRQRGSRAQSRSSWRERVKERSLGLIREGKGDRIGG